MTTDGKPPILNVIGERVALGPIRRDLVPLYARWRNDFATVRTLFRAPAPLTIESQVAWYERTATSDDSLASFTIYETAAWRPIGIAEWHAIDHRNRSVEYAIFIGETADRGKGYGTETTSEARLAGTDRTGVDAPHDRYPTVRGRLITIV